MASPLTPILCARPRVCRQSERGPMRPYRGQKEGLLQSKWGATMVKLSSDLVALHFDRNNTWFKKQRHHTLSLICTVHVKWLPCLGIHCMYALHAPSTASQAQHAPGLTQYSGNVATFYQTTSIDQLPQSRIHSSIFDWQTAAPVRRDSCHKENRLTHGEFAKVPVTTNCIMTTWETVDGEIWKRKVRYM